MCVDTVNCLRGLRNSYRIAADTCCGSCVAGGTFGGGVLVSFLMKPQKPSEHRGMERTICTCICRCRCRCRCIWIFTKKERGKGGKRERERDR